MRFKSFLNFLNNKDRIYKFLKRRAVITFLTLGIAIAYYDQIAMSILGDSYSRKHCIKALKERFEFTNKFFLNPVKEENDFCTIFLTNTYDAQKVMEIANYYKIPLINDVNSSQNILNFPHFKLDFTRYNRITEFNPNTKTITVEPGVKISEILKFLEKYDMSIPKLENYKHTDLTINEIYFNNYFGFNEGKFVDDLVDEITVAIPRNERVLKLKQNDDLTQTGLNLKNLFLRTNFTMGLIVESKLIVKKNKNMKYLYIQSLENKLDEMLGIVEEIRESKKELGLKDINIMYKDKEIDICLKIKDKHIQKSLEILKSTHLVFDQINKEDYYKSIVFSDTVINSSTSTPDNNSTHILRKLKINLNKNSVTGFLKKAEKLAIKNKIDMEFRCSYLNHELEMTIKSKDDLLSVENSYKFINKIHSLVLKASGNIFVNNNIKLTTRWHLMRDIGVENYKINEEIKYLFDPNYILNPHLSIKKPDSFFKEIKRNNKLHNYLLTKLKF